MAGFWQKFAFTAAAALFALNLRAEPVELIFVGDIMLDDGPGRLIGRGGDPLLPFSAILKDADYRIANLECPIAESGRALDNKHYTFRAKPRVLPVLQGRFDAVGLANNRNPLPIFIPCHRVIGANQKLTGYRGGLPLKQTLLELEQRHARI